MTIIVMLVAGFGVLFGVLLNIARTLRTIKDVLIDIFNLVSDIDNRR